MVWISVAKTYSDAQPVGSLQKLIQLSQTVMSVFRQIYTLCLGTVDGGVRPPTISFVLNVTRAHGRPGSRNLICQVTFWQIGPYPCAENLNP